MGVSADATEAILKRAYRMRSLTFHPDKKGGTTLAFQRAGGRAAGVRLSDGSHVEASLLSSILLFSSLLLFLSSLLSSLRRAW